MIGPARVAATAVLAFAAVFGLCGGAADASYPGANGLIVFVSNRGGGGFALYTMRANGSGVRRITPRTPALPHTTLPSVRQPAWSPDGSLIAFVRAGRIWIVTATGAGAHAVGPSGGVGFPTWSPDGTQLAFEWNDSVYRMNADGSGVTPVRLDEGAGSLSKWSPSWAAVGDRIAFVEGDGEHTGAILSMASDGTAVRRLTDGVHFTNADDAPDWSPNGRRVAFQRSVHCSGGHCGIAIFTVGAAGRGLHELLASGFEPSWSPNGTKLVFVRRAGGNTEIFTADASGAGVRRLTVNPASDFSPDWQPR